MGLALHLKHLRTPQPPNPNHPRLEGSLITGSFPHLSFEGFSQTSGIPLTGCLRGIGLPRWPKGFPFGCPLHPPGNKAFAGLPKQKGQPLRPELERTEWAWTFSPLLALFRGLPVCLFGQRKPRANMPGAFFFFPQPLKALGSIGPDRLGVVWGGPEERFHQGCTRVPPGSAGAAG